MTQNDTSPTIEVYYQFFPTAWAAGVSKEVFTLLVGPDKLYPATSWGNEGGRPLPTDSAELVEWLTDWYEASHRGNRMTLFTENLCRDYWFDLFRSEWDEKSLLGQLLFWPKTLSLRVPATLVNTTALDVLTEVSAITEAPLVTIDYRAGRHDEPITIAARREYKRVVQGTIHAQAAAGPWRGLHRIPWRLILGADIVTTIGVDKLNALPADRAIDHGNGLWSLQTSVDPAVSITSEGREAERQIIATLGEQFFAHTNRNQLAEVAPKFPPELIPQDSRLFERYGQRLKPL